MKKRRHMRKFLGILLAAVLIISALPLWAAQPVSAEEIKSKADIVFLIDSTGSMGDEISNVKTNLKNFTAILSDGGLNYRLAVIEYKDITADGSDTTKILSNSSGNTWSTSADEAAAVLDGISVDGGGDEDETVLDAIGLMNNRLTFREDASKFAILLTDAGYKVNNQYGYSDMNAAISALKSTGISTSVVSSTYLEPTYNSLYTSTDGIFCNIYDSNFAEQLAQIAEYIRTVIEPVEITLRSEEKGTDDEYAYFTFHATITSKDTENTAEITPVWILPDETEYKSDVISLAPGASTEISTDCRVELSSDNQNYTYKLRVDCDDFATGVVCIAQDTFSVAGTGKSDYSWDFKRDNYSFLNNYDAFGAEGNPYYISNSDLRAYLADLSDTEMNQTAEWYSHGSVSDLRENKLEEWGGSCYGMSLTAALFKAGILNPEDYSGSTTYTIPAISASSNTALESFINVYHISQASDAAMNSSNWDLEDLYTAATKIGKEGTGQQPLIVRMKSPRGGHAVVCYGCESDGYSFNGTNYGKRLLIADPNETEKTYIYLKSDYSSAEYSASAQYNKFGFRDTSLSNLNAHDLKDVTKNYAAKVIAEDTTTKYRISAPDGRYAVITGTKVLIDGGLGITTVEELDAGSSDTSNPFFLISHSADSYSIVPLEGTDVAASIYLDGYSVKVTGTAESVTAASNGDIDITGSDGSLKAELAVNDSTFDFVTVEGTADGDIGITVGSDSLSVDGDISDYTVENMDRSGNTISQSVSGDQDLVFRIQGNKLTSTEDENGMPFSDVKKSAFYYDAVKWAYTKGVTAGVTKTTFGPNQDCTRGQMIQFLYRAAGSPKVSGTVPFTDVSEKAFYYDAVRWAYANEVTLGTTDTTFSPNDTCTRSQMIQFIYKAQGSPKVSGTVPFTDVSDSAYYHDAVVWAYQNNVTSGKTDTLFGSKDSCTRGQMVTFLYAAYEKKS